ncbi:L-lactate permease, partial [Phytoactinopolyspora mesophila]
RNQGHQVEHPDSEVRRILTSWQPHTPTETTTSTPASRSVDRGLAVTPLLGGQGFGAAVGNIICPHNIVAASATVGLSGREGQVLRVTIPVALVYTALGGILAWWFLN